MRTTKKRGDLAALVKRMTVNAYFAFVSSMETQTWTHPPAMIDAVICRLPNLEQYSVGFGGRFDYSPHHFEVLAESFPRPFNDTIALIDMMSSDLGDERWPAVTLSIHTLNLRIPNNLFRLITPSRLSMRIDTPRVTQSDMHSQELEDILFCCVGLKSFIYEATRPSPSDMADPGSYPRQFCPYNAGIALSPYQDTLETLHLDLRYGRYYSGGWPSPLAEVGHFSALKTLLISSTAVCTWRQDIGNSVPERLVRMLPPNLVSLHLVGCPGNALPCFAEMFLALADAIQHMDQFRTLKHITCSARSVFTQELNDTFDRLAVAEAFARVGVEFNYQRPQLDSRVFDAEWKELEGCLDPDDERPWTYLWEDEDPVQVRNGTNTDTVNDEQQAL